MKNASYKNARSGEQLFFKKYVIQKILWSIIALLVLIGINILINKYAGVYFKEIVEKVSGNYLLSGLSFFISEILIGIFPAELFMMIYQSKNWQEYLIIVVILGMISSLCGFVAFSGGRYLKSANIAKMVIIRKKFKKYGGLFLKYGKVIIILAATTPLPFALISFVVGYYKFPQGTFLKIIVPIRIVRFLISAYLIKYSNILM